MVVYFIFALIIGIYYGQYGYKHREEYEDAPLIITTVIIGLLWPLTIIYLMYYIIKELKK